MKLKGQNIVIVSNEEWGDMWYSKHHYAHELSKNNRVFFINPCHKWNWRNVFKSTPVVEEIHDNLYTIQYNNLLPALSRLLFRINNFLVSHKLKKTLADHKVHTFIFWSFDPCRLYNPYRLGKCSLSIFHAVDLYKLTMYGEKLILANVDLIIGISDSIINVYKEFNKPTLVISHGISSEEFIIEDNGSYPEYRDFGLFVGNVDSRLDYELLEKIILKFSHIQFLFAGRVNINFEDQSAYRLFIQKKYANLIASGVIHAKKIKYYINVSKFCFVFTNKSDINKISHHKIFQYLAQGKPVFSDEFTEYMDSSDLLYMDNDQKKLIEKIDFFIKNGEDLELKEKRITYARNRTYERLFEKIEEFLYQIKHVE